MNMDANKKREDGLSDMARALGRKGGLARGRNLTSEKKSEIACHAATTRWARKKNGERLRRRLKHELISAARKKRPDERLNAFFNLSRNISLLSVSKKINGGLKIAR
ncbi:MAG: hypothetical protein COZ15_04955 [Elusimicrobia bacterium CG_4_10_14_3_um_filter_49_12_50_7]|nr:MAG: hypothetical protein COS41_04860 [Elusimicrobia bacterium CG03_land_8_20_14_0_80_50_18]PIX13937.1 MAG: hypothetical protein COZ72_07400 [Elusimicrobia bacterium CG_4_8_14_3_um_filter_50_9]PIY16645.1 MAG: hypothetical protein COZ15_04955 [Elusimicrobia bacterium CG_4_10_14_3_um_filter_49_12_50_7]